MSFSLCAVKLQCITTFFLHWVQLSLLSGEWGRNSQLGPALSVRANSSFLERLLRWILDLKKVLSVERGEPAHRLLNPSFLLISCETCKHSKGTKYQSLYSFISSFCLPDNFQRGRGCDHCTFFTQTGWGIDEPSQNSKK